MGVKNIQLMKVVEIHEGDAYYAHQDWIGRVGLFAIEDRVYIPGYSATKSRVDGFLGKYVDHFEFYAVKLKTPICA